VKKGPLQLPRTYLAGPMTGYEEHNFPAFEKLAAHLRQHGHIVVNPAELEALETGPRKEWAYYLKRDLKELLTCDHIAVMPNWQRSRGATLEVYVGWRLGFKIIEAETLAPIDVSAYNFSSIENETNSQAFVRAFTPPVFHREDPGFEERLAKVCREDNTPGKVFEVPPEFHQKMIEPKKESILDEAQRIVGGDRAKAYGHPRQDFERTAKIWEAITGRSFTAMEVSLCMIGVKISRQVNSEKRDNLVDIAGYARTAEMVMEANGQVLQ
jgi:hypothetical protein